ncbi:MAG: DUF2490 domain-containing protein [Mangrovibacterium sp.]
MQRILVSLFLTVLVFMAYAGDKRPTYLWNTNYLNLELGNQSTLCFSVKTQYSVTDNTREMTYLDCSAIRTVNSWLKLGLAFRLAQSPKATGDVYEYRPQLVTTVYNSRHVIKCRTTNRMEYRSFKRAKDHIRYYHNAFVDFPVLLAGIPRPYLGEELFTKMNGDGLHLARLYGGLHVWEKSGLGVDLFYVFQQTKSAEEWINSDIIGLNLKFYI